MAYPYNTSGTLSKKKTEYSRYYGNFRGVDFSNDHTQVNASRLAHLVNMYKDYKSGQGEALETMAGFRQRANFAKRPSIDAETGKDNQAPVIEENKEVYGVFFFKCKSGSDEVNRVVIHSGNKLFLWRNYPQSVNIPQASSLTVPAATATITGGIKEYSQVLPFECEAIISLKKSTGEDITLNASFDKATKTLSYRGSDISENDLLELSYYESVSAASDILFAAMNLHKSAYFIFNNRLYIMDGLNYLVYDGETVKPVKDSAYIPTTYINIVPAGANADAGVEYEQRNILTPKFKHTFVADGETTEFLMNENELDSVVSVKVYGAEKAAGTDYTVDLANGKITFKTAPSAPQNTVRETVGGETVYYEQGFAGVEITAAKTYTSIDGVTENMSDISELISKCTLCTTYDGRVFCTGNPDYHNHVFFCGRNNTGYADPSYFGILNYMQDGVGLAPITGIMCVSDTLMVLKSDTQQDSSIYFHTATDSGQNLIPRIYPSVQGLSGLGCVGACCNFLDDPIFISRLGVEGVSQLRIASERANEHRSRLIDAKLVNTDLSKVSLEEWGGYLCVLTGGNIFLADSRQRYEDTTGAMQYEWYYLEKIGVWDNQYREYKYSSTIAEELKGATFTHDDGNEYEIELAENVYLPDVDETRNLCETVVNEPDDDGNNATQIYTKTIPVMIGDLEYPITITYTINEAKSTLVDGEPEKHAYLCETRGNFTGGVFRQATVLRSMDDNLFFGCENGVICSFNFDQRDENGELPSQTYNFDNRTIYCGCATLMDNCQIPHLTKTTIKRSTVIKTKSFTNSSAKVKVRTNKKPYNQIARINSSMFSFNDVDFSDFSFITSDQSLFAVKEKEKQWVEKQYYIYSDEYLKPFALYYISFRYRVAGRYKG